MCNMLRGSNIGWQTWNCRSCQLWSYIWKILHWRVDSYWKKRMPELQKESNQKSQSCEIVFFLLLFWNCISRKTLLIYNFDIRNFVTIWLLSCRWKEITISNENFTTLKKDVRKIYPQSLPLTVADNSENEQLRKVNEEQSKKISNFQREITILEEKLKEKDAELEKRKTELSHLRQGSKINI